jgi:cytochrome c553
MSDRAGIRHGSRHLVGLMGGVCALVAVLSVAQAQIDDAKLRSYGQHLGRECVACHRIDGVDNGIPGIVGWTTDVFVETMGYYRDGRRPNQVMISVAQSLDEDQLKALAAYFASLPPQPKAAMATPTTAQPNKR